MKELLAYLFLVGLVAVQRLWELKVSRNNEGILKKRGAFEVGSGHFIWMQLLHTCWLMSCLTEALLQKVPTPSGFLSGFFLLTLIIGQLFRRLSIKSLGERWTVKVFILPGEKLIHSGPYKFFSHPNYIGVIIEIFSLPAIFGLWKTAVVFSVLNVLLLNHRIKIEEKGWGVRE